MSHANRWNGFSWSALASTLAAAGLGLLLWLGVSIALLQGGDAEPPLLRSMQQAGLSLGGALALFALSTLRPGAGTAGSRKWRPLGLAALALVLAGAVCAGLMLGRESADPALLALSAALLGFGAVVAVLATGMVAAADGREAWRSQMVAPNFLAYALLVGASVLFALIALKWPGQGLLSAPTASLVMLLVVAAALKVLYWFENGGMRGPVAGVRVTALFRQRLLVLALLAGVPLILAGALQAWPSLFPRAGWVLVALSVLAGGYMERRLLAIEAGLAAHGDGSSRTLNESIEKS